MLYFIIIIYAVIATAHKIPYRVCRDGDNNLRKHLSNKMVWQEDLQNFIQISQTCSEMLRSLTINNNTLKIAVCELEPYVRLNKDGDRIEGFLGDLWSVILEVFDFEYVFIPTTFKGGLQLTENDKADIFFSSAVPIEDYYNAAFSQPYMANWYYIYLKSPNLAISSAFYLKACSTQFWSVTISSFIILTAAICTIGRILKKIDPDEPNVSIPSCFLASTSGLLNQGYDLKFRSYSARTMIFFSMILGTIIYTAISAVLYSKMTVRDLSFPINSLSEIPKTGYHLCMRNDTFVYSTFLDSNQEIVPEWKSTINGDNCIDNVHQITLNRLICEREVVVLENSFMMSFALLQQNNSLACQVTHLKQKLFKNGNVFYIAKHMKYFQAIQRVFIKMKSSGVLQYLEMKYRKKPVDQEYESRWYTVTFDHVKGVLLWYVGMVFLSIVLLGIEILCEKRTYYKSYA